MERPLWRLHNVGPAPHLPEQFDAGFRLHVAHTDLLSIIMQIGEQQQAYISTVGCEGCRQGRHQPGCYLELLRRLLVATYDPKSDVRLISSGLARCSYRYICFAQPTRHSVPFTSAALTRWREARVAVHWHCGPRGLSTAALLAVGEEPNPAILFQEYGWSVRLLPRRIGVYMANIPIPTSVWFRRAWSGAPFWFTPCAHFMPFEA